MTQPLGHPEPEEDHKTVPLTVYLKDGHLVDPNTGGEKHVIGKATIRGTEVLMMLNDELPEGVMDAVAGTYGPVPMSLGFEPPVKLAIPKEPPALWDWHKHP